MRTLTPSELVEHRVVLKEDDPLRIKVMKENLVAFLHEYFYIPPKKREFILTIIGKESEDAARALRRLF